MTDDLNNITMQLLKAHPHDSGMVKAREMIEEMIKDRDQKLSAQINREREESMEAREFASWLDDKNLWLAEGVDDGKRWQGKRSNQGV